tara:strand:- start:17847 stop:18224 length:378 start_codon:yes stop_codon:yes gene_type:complete
MNKITYIKNQINNLSNPIKILDEIIKYAKNNNIIIVFLQKDDHYESIEIKGYINNSFDFWSLNSIIIKEKEAIPSKKEKIHNSIYFYKINEDNFFWKINSNIINESFTIMDYDNSIYCEGLILQL